MLLLLRSLFIIVHMLIWDLTAFAIPISASLGIRRGSLWLPWPEMNEIESLEIRLRVVASAQARKVFK
jgi:hypothetical protein